MLVWEREGAGMEGGLPSMTAVLVAVAVAVASICWVLVVDTRTVVVTVRVTVDFGRVVDTVTVCED